MIRINRGSALAQVALSLTLALAAAAGAAAMGSSPVAAVQDAVAQDGGVETRTQDLGKGETLKTTVQKNFKTGEERTLSSELWQGAHMRFAWRYTYDDNGVLTSVTRIVDMTDKGGERVELTNTWDARGRRTGITRTVYNAKGEVVSSVEITIDYASGAPRVKGRKTETGEDEKKTETVGIDDAVKTLGVDKKDLYIDPKDLPQQPGTKTPKGGKGAKGSTPRVRARQDAATKRATRREALVVDLGDKYSFFDAGTLADNFAADADGLGTLLGGRGYTVTRFSQFWDGTHSRLTDRLLENTISSYAATLRPGDTLFLYLGGHGNATGVSLYDSDGKTSTFISYARLDRWLDTLDPGVGVTVMLDACECGGAIPALSGANRTIMTATDAATSAAGGQGLTDSFTQDFLQAFSDPAGADSDRNGPSTSTRPSATPSSRAPRTTRSAADRSARPPPRTPGPGPAETEAGRAST